MDKVKSVFDCDEFGDPVDESIKSAYLKFVSLDAEARAVFAVRHAALSKPRELSDDDFCVREGYRDVLSQFKELQMAGRVLAKARAEQYDPDGVEDVDPTTRMDYDIFDAADDARRVSERLKAQQAAAQEAPAPEAPAPEAPSSSAQ